MADEIKHGSVNVVNASALVTDAALANAYANTPAAIVANNTQMFTVTVDKKGRITQSAVASINTTGITYANTNDAGTASGSFAHLANQKIHISSSAPANNDIGNNGDIWYQTL
jgi:hypothetical protein